jgi:hypothetical protein
MNSSASPKIRFCQTQMQYPTEVLLAEPRKPPSSVKQNSDQTRADPASTLSLFQEDVVDTGRDAVDERQHRALREHRRERAWKCFLVPVRSGLTFRLQRKAPTNDFKVACAL